MKWFFRRLSPAPALPSATSPYREAPAEPAEIAQDTPPVPLRTVSPASPLGRLRRTFHAKSGLDNADKFLLGLVFALTPFAVFSLPMLLCGGSLSLIPLLRFLDRALLQALEVRVHSAGVEIVRRGAVETVFFPHVTLVTVAPLALYTIDRRVVRLDLHRFDDPDALVAAIADRLPAGLVKGRAPEPVRW